MKMSVPVHRHFFLLRQFCFPFFCRSLRFSIFAFSLLPFLTFPLSHYNKISLPAFMNWLSDIRLLLLCLWLGAACFFSFAVAPSAFGVLPSRELAGLVVNRTLRIVNYSGFVIGLVLLLSPDAWRQNVNRLRLLLERSAASRSTIYTFIR
jgi:hypothetical protein